MPGLNIQTSLDVVWALEILQITYFRKMEWVICLLDAVGSSRILIGKQKIGLTFNSDKLGGNDFTKFSKLTMCSA